MATKTRVRRILRAADRRDTLKAIGLLILEVWLVLSNKGIWDRYSEKTAQKALDVYLPQRTGHPDERR